MSKDSRGSSDLHIDFRAPVVPEGWPGAETSLQMIIGHFLDEEGMPLLPGTKAASIYVSTQ